MIMPNRAHAALSPWEGQNALDAAVLAYTNISLLRQQVKPTARIHGIFSGQDWAVNVIPDNATMSWVKFGNPRGTWSKTIAGIRWVVRGPTLAEAKETFKRVKPCFEYAVFMVYSEVIGVTQILTRAAALASNCEVKIDVHHFGYDLRQNAALGKHPRQK